MQRSQELINKIAQIIYDKKGSNILALDLKGVSSLTDYLVIAEGYVGRHVISMGHAILNDIKDPPVHVEGLQSGDWVVLDFSNVVVHLFQPGWREKYSLEKLWKKGQIVDLDLSISEAPCERSINI